MPLPQVDPFVVRWQGVKFERDAAADASKVKQPGKAATVSSKASYKLGSVADNYGELLEIMPPLKHDKDPTLSDVIAYICEKVASLEGECSTKEGQRIYYCLANMKRKSPLLFDRATKLWRGRNHAS